jgi:hypothetical protein
VENKIQIKTRIGRRNEKEKRMRKREKERKRGEKKEEERVSRLGVGGRRKKVEKWRDRNG